jgi:predicted RND superfamily exporter protein
MAWKLLFGTDIGLLSLFTIVFIIGMAIYLYVFVRNRIREEEQRRLRKG